MDEVRKVESMFARGSPRASGRGSCLPTSHSKWSTNCRQSEPSNRLFRTTIAQDALKQRCWGGVGLLWSALQRKCAPRRVGAHVLMRDFDIPSPHAAADVRRLEVIANGLLLFDGAHLTLDTTMDFPLHLDGTAAEVGGGHRRRRNSSGLLPSTAPKKRPGSCADGCSLRG